jgi:hypothetical protein
MGALARPSLATISILTPAPPLRTPALMSARWTRSRATTAHGVAWQPDCSLADADESSRAYGPICVGIVPDAVREIDGSAHLLVFGEQVGCSRLVEGQ